jgi:hypothetical protein
MLLDSYPFACPWCGETNQVALEPEEAGQRVVQDCVVCCAPIEIQLPLFESDSPTIFREGE